MINIRGIDYFSNKIHTISKGKRMNNKKKGGERSYMSQIKLISW